MTSGKTAATKSVRNLQDYFRQERRGGNRGRSGWGQNGRPEVNRLRQALHEAGFLAAATSDEVGYLSDAQATAAADSWKDFPGCMAAYPMQLSKRNVHGIKVLSKPKPEVEVSKG